MQSKWNPLFSSLPFAILLGISLLPVETAPRIRLVLLAEPVAWLAGQGMQSPVLRDAATGWPVLAGWFGPVRITPECAGLQFWMIATAVAWFRIPFPRTGLSGWRGWLAGVGCAYLLTLLLNTSRILLVAAAQPLARCLPPSLGSTVHLGVGVMVFLPGLIVFSLLLTQWSARHGFDIHSN